MKLFIIISGILIAICLIAEKKAAVRHRRALKHLIHINGTRGKSAVTRLIAAGLREGGVRTICKTTGTVPMMITPDGEEIAIQRKAPANIKEQIWMLKQSFKYSADTMVVECMAVDPELQYISEHKILHSDIGVLTNARIDHVAEMGNTIEDVANALSNTIPDGGTVFTSDEDVFEIVKRNAEAIGTTAFLSKVTNNNLEEFLIPENIELALDVCEYVGVDRDTALRGMRSVQEDPYTSYCVEIGENSLFINAMSANDPKSTKFLFDKYTRNRKFDYLVYIFNCRKDRGYRTELMLGLIEDSEPDEVWLMGSGTGAAYKILSKNKKIKTIKYKKAEELPFSDLKNGTVIMAIGNIAGEGIKLTEMMKENKD